MSKSDVILIPGWLNGPKMYGRAFPVLEIWKDKIEPFHALEQKYLIAHSLGASWALFHWEIFKDKKLILVNPLFPKRGLWEWFQNWKRFQKFENNYSNKEIIKAAGAVIFGLKWCYRFLAKDFSDILHECAENIIVIRGQKDEFFCDNRAVEFLKTMGVQIYEVEGGHDWNEEMAKKIEELLR